MIGLEYILNLYNMQHVELADKLEIRKQNINLWIKGRQNIPKKYLPILEEIFKLDRKYFTRELSQIDKLEIQKEKLKMDLKPIIASQEERFSIGTINDMVEVPIYDREELNTIERDIEKARLVERFAQALDMVDKNPYIEIYKLLMEILEKASHEVVVHRTVEALAHYYELLPDWVSSDPGQAEFEEEIFEVFDDYNY